MAVTLESFQRQVATGRTVTRATTLTQTAQELGNAGDDPYTIRWDNTLNTTVNSFGKFYNTASVTPGVTLPDMILPFPQGEANSVVFPQGLTGIFTSNMYSNVTTDDGTGGTPANDPVSSVVIEAETNS